MAYPDTNYRISDEIVRMEMESLRGSLELKKKECDEKTRQVNTLQQSFDEQTKELQKLQILVMKEHIDRELMLSKLNECTICDREEGGKNKTEITEDEFEKLLKKSRKQAKKDLNIMNYSTSNFAYGVFDRRGGKLTIEKANVELFIPPGAISSTQQEIYIYIDPKARFSKADQANHRQGKKKGKTRVAPIILCGPPGITFLDHVVLTIPHNAENEDKWEFTPVRSEGDRHADDWKNIDTDTNGGDDIVFVNGGFCVFMVKHFTCFTMMKDLN